MSGDPPAATGPAHGRRIAVIGLGYVGLPVAAAFGERGPVVAFDSDAARIEELRRGVDRNATVGAKRLAAPLLEFTRDPRDLGRADFFIVAVPTPVDEAKHPDLGALEAASRTVGGEIRPGAIVVYESTVYPGATEDVCIPILEEASGLRAGRDFFVGYSPERINPGDEAHGFARIVKVVAAGDPDTLETVAGVYGSVVEAGVHRAPSIRVAEAAKVIENTQRDVNIALMNEVAMIFERLGIDTGDVLAAAGTKWNFLPFRPGLVGGHCIGVDPYYLTHEAMRAGHHPEIILSGRRINDAHAGLGDRVAPGVGDAFEIGSFVASSVVRLLVRAGAPVNEAVVTVLGATFKENVPDVRNSGTARIVEEFRRYGMDVQVHDPVADHESARAELGVGLTRREDLRPARAVVLAVAHDEWRQEDALANAWTLVGSLLENGVGVVADVPRLLARDRAPPGVRLWRL